MDLNHFFEELASEKPVPGGGSASCIAAAEAVALLEMVVRLSVGRENEKEIDEKFTRLLEKLKTAYSYFLSLAEKDADGYQKVMESFRLPKRTETEKARRKQAIQSAFEGAIASPLELMQNATDLLRWNIFILEHGNKNAFSDAGVAFHLICVAFEGGKMNVLINVDSLHNPVKKREYIREVASLEETFTSLKHQAEKQIEKWLVSLSKG